MVEMEFRNTVEQMLLTNDSLYYYLSNKYESVDFKKKIINIELFFLTFNLFYDCFRQVDFTIEWREAIYKNNYYIKDDKIFINESECSYDLLEFAFRKTLEIYSNCRIKRVIEFDKDREVKRRKLKENISDEDKVLMFDREEYLSRKIVEKNNAYRFDQTTKNMLTYNKSSFREAAYNGIVSIYNRLLNNNNVFKELPLIEKKCSNKMITNFGYMLLIFYPVIFYDRDKDFIDYNKLLICNLYAEPFRFRFSRKWQEYNKQMKKYDDCIKNCDIVINNKKVSADEKARAKRTKKEFLREKKEFDIKEGTIFLSNVEVREVCVDNDETKSVYAGYDWNKHLVYHLANALRHGCVDVSSINSNFGYLKLYSYIGKDLDYAIEISNSGMCNIFIIDNLIDSLKSCDYSKGRIKTN